MGASAFMAYSAPSVLAATPAPCRSASAINAAAVSFASEARPASRRASSLLWLHRARIRVLVVGVFLLPLVVFPALDDELVLPKLLVSRALVLILAALWLLESARRGSIAIRRTPLDVPLLAFAGSAVLSTLLAVNPNVAVFGTYGRYEGLLTLLTYIALFWRSAETMQ